RLALARVAVEQCIARAALGDERQLPREVLCVLHARVRTARAERRDAMRGVAGENHAAMAKVLHALAGEGVDAGPDNLEARVAGTDAREHCANARHDVLGLALELGVGVPAELEVHSPNAVGLLVQQRALPRMERRVEPEAALAGK